MGQEQCEIPHFQEDQLLEEDAMLVALEERGKARRISFPLPGVLFSFACMICTKSWFGKAALLKPFIEAGVWIMLTVYIYLRAEETYVIAMISPWKRKTKQQLLCPKGVKASLVFIASRISQFQMCQDKCSIWEK